MANVNNCLKLFHAELDLVVLANIQACTSFEVPGEKCKRSARCNFLFQWNNSLHFDAKLYGCCLLLCKVSDCNRLRFSNF